MNIDNNDIFITFNDSNNIHLCEHNTFKDV